MMLLRFSIYVSFACLIYVVFMGVVNLFEIDFLGLRFIVELITIPFLILIPFPFYLAVRYYGMSPEMAKKSIYITTATVVLLFIFSIFM